MRFFSPAKVNLHLEVMGKRPDGYHEIQTLMQRVDLYDEMEILPGGEGIRVISEGEPIPGGMDNLAWQAAQIFCREVGVRGNWEIRIRKRIPVAAGLGGGSGNAATVLMALNQLLKTGWEPESLMTLGATLGADVPFFIFQRPALARGKGDRLTAVKLPDSLWFLMLVPPFRISTAWAYETFDQMAGEKEKEGTPLKEIYDSLGDLLPVLKNDLEIPALSRYPEIQWMKEQLLQKGAKGALMSGSGPVACGLFQSREEAKKAQRSLVIPPGWKIEIGCGI
jgi:4-diphosphocytidyl-2-C-methyl-D-erythritol kinase